MKNKLFIVLALFSALIFASCSEHLGNYDPTEQVSLDRSKIVTENNQFAMKMFSVADNQNQSEENIVLSPLSLNMALAMVWNGANGQTKADILTAMGMSNYAYEEVNAYYHSLTADLQNADPNTQLALANSIWYRMGFPVKQDFITTNQTYYDAIVQALNFNDATGSAATINQWCADHTNNLIDGIISTDDITPETVMFLLNALYFKSMWADSCGFDPEGTMSNSFTKANGQTISVQMMSQQNTLPYYSDNTLQMVTIPYGNKRFSMTFVLPNNGTTFSSMLNALQANGYWQQCISNRSEEFVKLDVPKFKLEYTQKFNNILTTLGMGVAFSDAADFSNLSDLSTKIGFVRQKTYIDVNEQGTEAAAVTAIGIEFTSALPSYPVFRADRPFLFVIQDEETGAVLFMGKVGNPEYSNK